MKDLVDRDARERAATATDRNIVVTAGAGTGKTTLLVDRLMHLLVRQPHPIAIGEIVALTFTNKAANEIKLRLRERLSILMELDFGNPPESLPRRRVWSHLQDLRTHSPLTEERLRDLAQKALRDLEKSQIGTIHSFAAHLLRLYPVESCIDPSFKEDEGQGFKEHFAEEWIRWLDEELTGSGPRHDIWKLVLRKIELEDIRALAMGFAGELVPLRQTPALVENGDLSPPLRHWLTQLAESARLLRCTHSKANTLERMLDGAACYLQLVAERGLQVTEIREGVEELERSLPAITTTWSREDYHLAKRVIAVAQGLMRLDTDVLAPLQGLLVPFVEGCRRSFVQSGYLSFDGLLARARDLLRDHPSVRRELKRQIKAIMVDEFQDTDPVQYEMILFLAEIEDTEERDWRRVRLAAGKLFVVGDPKQSIYAFRRADMEAYDTIVDDKILAQSPSGERHALQSNFRSHHGLLNPINTFFAAHFPSETIRGLQPKNEPLLASTQDMTPLPSERLEIRLVRLGEPDGDAGLASRAEAQELARWLSAEVLYQQEIREHDAPVTVKPKHVAILFRTLTQVRDYLEALRQYEIPCLTEGEKDFYERQEIIDAVNLLRAVANPYDQLSVVGVLRSTVGLLPDRAIEALIRQDLLDYRVPVDLSSPAIAGQPLEGINQVYAMLRDLHHQLPVLPLTEVVDTVFAKTPLLEMAAMSSDDEQAVANLLKLREIVTELAQRPDLTLQGLIHELTSRVNQPPEEGGSQLAEEIEAGSEQSGAVRLLSIHKAKGLEFPMVILAGLHRGAARKEPQILVHHDWSADLVGLRVGNLQTVEGLYVATKLSERQQAEHIRVLYVAMTRAKRRLVLSGALPQKISPDSFLALVGRGMGLDLSSVETTTTQVGEGEVQIQVVPTPGAEGHQRAHGRPWNTADDDISGLIARWNNRATRWQDLRQAPLFVSPTSLKTDYALARGGVTQPFPIRESHGDRSRLTGTLAHQVLETWDFAEDPAALEDRIRLVCADNVAPELVSELEGIVTDLTEMLRAFSASSAYHALRRANILGREVPFAIPWGGRTPDQSKLPSSSQVMEGVIDLVYELDGQIWIADYKTDRLPEERLAERTLEYRGQAEIYREAVARSVGVSHVTFQFIFLRHGLAVSA